MRWSARPGQWCSRRTQRTVAIDQSALLEVLDALKVAEVDDRIRQAAQTIYQALIEAELTAVIGAAPNQRTPDRLAQRNGHRPRLLSTTAGDLELRIPKLRAGSFFPSLLERRRRVDQALFAVVMEAYLHGVSTRKVDDLVRAFGADSGISKSEVSRICADLDDLVLRSAERCPPGRTADGEQITALRRVVIGRGSRSREVRAGGCSHARLRARSSGRAAHGRVKPARWLSI